MKSKLILLFLVPFMALALLPFVAAAQNVGGGDRGSATAVAHSQSSTRLALISERTGLIASEIPLSADCAYDAAERVYLCQPPDITVHSQRDLLAAAHAQQALNTVGLLLIPDSNSDRVMAFDPITGNLLDPNFIPTENAIGTAIHAILSHDRQHILLSDQTGDVVHRFRLDDRSYLGVFAPAGGADTAIMNNVRGMSLGANGNLLVTSAEPTNADAIVRFDTGGNFTGNFIANNAGGLDAPFDIYGRDADWLVSGIDSDAIHRYDLTGAYIANLMLVDTFPEQIAEAANGNVLVANFSPSTEEGILEYTAAGVFVGRYDPPGLAGYRGVYELPGGTILTTTGAGVHEIDRSGNLVENKITGVSARFIEYIPPQSPPELFCNPAAIAIPGVGTLPGPAAPYPSEIVVSGLGAALDINVRLLGINHTWPDDIDILLVGPEGQNLIIMSDAGGSGSIVSVNLIFDDAAPGPLPDLSQISSGTYRPTNYGIGDSFPAPAPTPSAETQLAIFIGTNPNGTWGLYVFDDLDGDVGSIAGGWCLEIAAVPNYSLYLPVVIK